MAQNRGYSVVVRLTGRPAQATRSAIGTISILGTSCALVLTALQADSAPALIGGPIAAAATPIAIAITRDGTRACVANNGCTVELIDLATHTPVGAPILVGSNPMAVAITPQGGRAYVVNGGDWR